MEEPLGRFDKRIDINHLPEQYAAEEQAKKDWEKIQPWAIVAIVIIVILAIGFANTLDQGSIGATISTGEMSPRSMAELALFVVAGVTLVFTVIAIRVRRSRPRAR